MMSGAAATTDAPPASGQNRYLVLGLLFALNTLLVLDKIVFTILLEPIKHEFNLSDLQLGVLSGLVYAVCMGLAGIPLGIIADRVSRRNLAAACLAVWSAMTALCGIANSFTHLLLARVGVGLGEAGGGPAAVSIISDLFEHRKRATAMALFSVGTPTAALINLTINTQVSHYFGWRAALLAAAVPGLILAAVIMLVMKEPQRGLSDRKLAMAGAPPLGETLRFVASQKSLLHILAGALICYVVLAGVSSWHFSFLVRTYGVSLKEVGPILGVCIASAGIAGLFLSGWAADRLARLDERWRAWVMACTTLLSVAIGLAAFLAPNWPLALAFGSLFAATATVWLAPALALTQSLVHIRMRATVGAIMFLLANLVGYGAGPSIAGFLSDRFTAMGVAEPLRMALLAMLSINLLAALQFVLAARTVRADLVRTASAST